MKNELDLIIELLPDDYKNYFSPIMFTFYELKKGSSLGLFHYKVDENGGKIENDKNFHRQADSLIEMFKAISPALSNRRNPPSFPKSKEELDLSDCLNFEDIEIWKERKLLECESALKKNEVRNSKPTNEQLSERVTDGIWLHIPKEPKVLKSELEFQLSRHTNDDNIKIVIEALFGSKRLPRKTEEEKFYKFMIQKLIPKRK